MKQSFTTRILVCVLPVLVGLGIVGWAYSKYDQGQGGFRLGVDLVGGTILVYEVDTSKPLPEGFKIEELAASLKRRIDPNDLLNVTIRPVPSVAGSTPRVEIILPIGGRKQAEAKEKAWQQLLQEVTQAFPPKEGQAYDEVPVGQERELIDLVVSNRKGPGVDEAQLFNEVSTFIRERTRNTEGQKRLTGEDIESIKSLIEQQGRLEFRILANRTDDLPAIQAAEAYFKDPAHKAELVRAEEFGEPPPPPRNADGGTTFPVTLKGETVEHSYSWVEIGKEELYSLGLNNKAKDDPKRQRAWEAVAAAREKGETTTAVPGLQDCLVYSRKITNTERLLQRDKEQGKQYEYFVLTREPEEVIDTATGQREKKAITGDYLVSARQGFGGKRQGLIVEFRFNSEGAILFADLTRKNAPSAEGGLSRHLAIILDGQVRSAPVINQPITGGSGYIEGDFTPKDVDTLVKILRAGALPATLKPKPVAENTIGATLGEDTIRSGTRAVGYAFLIVLAFMLVYYRFAGLVACIALFANLILTVAFMVLVHAAFTLPGLAGLVLMLGMAVDANVLIYERLREERERGASLALAIRNGYDRAFPTIIDTHLSSIFTAIVLFVVGNDQLKGFGISLTVGLIISLFTSLYMTRTMFDLWLARGWLKRLYMMHIFRRLPHFDFMAIRYYWFTATILLTILGFTLFVVRGQAGLDIDFVGGTAYTGQLNEMATIGELREDLKNLDLPDLSIGQVFLNAPEFSQGERTKIFTVLTTEKNADDVQRKISELLGPKLKRIEVKDYKIVPDEKDPKNATKAVLEFADPSTGDRDKPETWKDDYASPAQVGRLLAENLGKNRTFRLTPAPGGKTKEQRVTKMELILNEPMPKDDLKQAIEKTKATFHNMPQPERLENFDSQLAAATQEKALAAIVLSWAAILLYLWFRFGSWTFGAATVLCLIHDLFFTLGAIAACHYAHAWFGNVLGIGDFKINLPTVAALLTLVGYSVNDTIVVFDRIREVRGKNPLLTPQMINDSVNQTLSRTLLSAATVWFVVIVLYAFGGEGVRLFAFVMIVGVIVGTYSSIYIASPLLLIFGEGKSPAAARARAQEASTAIRPA
jgi:SecD/SecF fusion protein